MTDEDGAITTHATIDEAIAVAIGESVPGDVVEVHAEDCEIDDNDEGCTCEAMRLVVGAQA